MATFGQWSRNRKITRVAWVCGREQVLAGAVRQAYQRALPAAVEQVAWADSPGIWDDLLAIPARPRLLVIRAVESLEQVSLLPCLLGDEFDGSYAIFLSAEDDFRRAGKDLVPSLAALRDSRHGQLIRCCPPAASEDQADLVASWWPGAGRNVATALLDECGGSLARAWHAADKAMRAGLAPELPMVPVVCAGAAGEGFADLLVRGDRTRAMTAIQEVPPGSEGAVLSLLATRLQLLPLVRDAIARREEPAETVRRLRADAWLLRQLRSQAGQYAPERAARCQELLAVAEEAWRSGVRAGILEAVVALWLPSRIRGMSDVRDPERDQHLPVPGKEPVHELLMNSLMLDSSLNGEVCQRIMEGLEARRALGVSKYGRLLETHNGRDALLDTWEELLDAASYFHQVVLEEESSPLASYIAGHIKRALEGVDRLLMQRHYTELTP